MGFFDRWRAVRDVANAPTFDAHQIGTGEIDPAVFGLTSYADTIAPAPRVSRREAIQVPAVKRGRDLICGTIGPLPFRMLDTDNVATVSTLLAQPERNVARAVTMARLVEDLLFESVAWWRVTERDYRGYPSKVVRLLPRTVNQQQNGKTYVAADGNSQGNSWVYVEDRDLIRFDSLTDGILDAGARAIRTYLKLATTADRYADEPMPSGYFQARQADVDPDTDDVEEALDEWAADRRTRSTGYVPPALEYKVVQFSPEQLQMSDSRQAAVVEIGRVMGIDPEDLGVSTTSRTYQNSQDRRLSMINDVLGMYVAAIAERLSMGDLTPRGYRVVADFNGFLKADDKTRLETYAIGVGLGLYDRHGIAEREGIPDPVFDMPAQTPAQPAIEASMTPSSTTFDAAPGVFGFDTDEQRNAFEVDRESRTIFGLAVPYGVAAKKNGHRFQFSRGSLTYPEVSRVKLLMQHDRSQAVGKAVEFTDSPEGLWVKFQVARGPEGDRALTLAEDGVFDGLSIGLRDGGKFSRREGINHSVSNEIAEISLTPDPAFSDARVSAVAAEADSRKDAPMGDQDKTTEPVTESAPTFDMDSVIAALGEKFEMTPKPAAGPEVIAPATSAATFDVTEESPYRFDRGGNLKSGKFDFSTDLIDGLRNGNREALDRALGFAQENLTFDVDMADAASLNPSIQRPDLYVDRRAFKYPLLDATRAGTLSDRTPFVIPKYSSSSGLVAAHTEGVEPTPGTFVATSQTVTPGALSGKVEITRELWDQGGNPQASGLIWNKMEQAYYEAAEAKVVAAMVAEAGNITDIALTAGGGTDGQTLSAELGQAFAALQYVRGGFAFDYLAAQIDLFQHIVGAKDTTKRPLFPIYGPTNANGTAEPKLAGVNVYGVQANPAWALAATGAVVANSWLFDRQSVRTWLSAPERLTFEYRVAYVDLAIWGYQVAAVLDTAGVRQITYDPVA